MSKVRKYTLYLYLHAFYTIINANTVEQRGGQHMIKHKILFTTVILTASLIIWTVPTSVAGEIPMDTHEEPLNGINEKIETVVITKPLETPINASIRDNVLILQPIPESPLYNYFHIQIYPSDYSTDAIYDIYPGSAIQGYPFHYPLPNLKDGGYNFTIRTAETSSTIYNFSHWIHTPIKQIPFSVKNGEAFFEAFPVYKNNADRVSKYRTDSAALDYYKLPTDSIQSDNIEIKNLASKITENASTDYEKARLIHDWVAENIWYDSDAANGPNSISWSSQSALTVLHDKKAVCAGYSNLTAALMRAAGIPCKFVSGELGSWNIPGKSGEPHAWNEAFVDGRWIFIDTTGDSGNYYSNGKYGKQVFVYSSFFTYDTFFDTPLFSFSLDHRIDGIDEPPRDALPISAIIATPTTSKFEIDGNMIAIDAYSIDNSTYFKLRDLAYLLHTRGSDKQFEITWDNITKSINIITSEKYTPVGGELKVGSRTGSQSATVNTSFIYLDGKRFQFTSYTINDNNYFKLRDIASAINFDVDWDASSNTIIFDYLCDYTPD